MSQMEPLVKRETSKGNSKTVPEVDVLVLNFNGMQHLGACLDSVLKTDYANLNVTLVDNGSTDGSQKFVKHNYPEVKILANKKNLGFSKGYNNAASSSQTPVLVFLNNDVEVDKDWLKELVGSLADPEVGCATSKIMFFHERQKINACGGFIDKFGFAANRGNGEVDLGQYSKAEEVFYAVGAAMAVKRSAWNTVGPFDEDFFAYCEDVDWCWRARLQGYKIVYVPSSIIYHKWRGSLREKRRSTQIYFEERNRLATLLKNYGWISLLSIIPRYLVLETLKILWVLRNWTHSEAIIVMKALFWNLNHLNDTIKKRVQVQRKRKRTDKGVSKTMVNTSLELYIALRPYSSLANHPFFS